MVVNPSDRRGVLVIRCICDREVGQSGDADGCGTVGRKIQGLCPALGVTTGSSGGD
jgi:hypothetical protein